MLMTYEEWDNITNFSPKEFGATGMSKLLIYTLQDMRDYTELRFGERKIIIHSGYREGSIGYHPLKMAVDLHIEGLHVIDQYLIAERFDAFNGIGVYPNWDQPGIHVDVRPKSKTNFDSRWGCLEKGVYLALNKEFFDKMP